ncbi:Ig-like domain-containing protein [Brevibacillus porteri]|uniref:Ig-like domain-containing protein n=1 Tax=Brevibacillus porteri TaxID=2126350 RepID=UPI003D1F2F03
MTKIVDLPMHFMDMNGNLNMEAIESFKSEVNNDSGNTIYYFELICKPSLPPAFNEASETFLQFIDVEQKFIFSSNTSTIGKLISFNYNQSQRKLYGSVVLEKSDIGKELSLLTKYVQGTSDYFGFIASYRVLYKDGTFSDKHVRINAKAFPVLTVSSSWFNTSPTIIITSPSNNQSLTEGNTFTIAGSTTDVNAGNVVTVRYTLNNGTDRALHSGVSDGNNPISFSKVLAYRGGRLYDGAVDVSGALAEGTTHTLSVWAEDDQGGKSDIVTRSFTVKHNKAPVLAVNPFTPVQSGLIPPDTLTLSGTVSEPDGNTVTVKGKLNSGSEKTLLSGVSTGNWSFPFKVSELLAGTNTLTITASDQFGSSSVKSFSINNNVVQTPLKKAVARYKIIPPRGSAKEILAWLKREKGDLVVDGEASFVDAGQPEQYVAMSKNSIDLTSSISEDEILSTVATAKSNPTFKLTFSRLNTNSTHAATMMVGVIE